MPAWQQRSLQSMSSPAGLVLSGLRRAEQRRLVSSVAAINAATSMPRSRQWAVATPSAVSIWSRRLHTEQQQQHTSTQTHDSMPPPPSASTSSKLGSSSSSRPASSSSSPSSSRSAAPSTSDISRVTPVATTPGVERGAAHNQESVALSQLAEKQALEKAKQEAEEKRLREMGVVKRVWEKVK